MTIGRLLVLILWTGERGEGSGKIDGLHAAADPWRLGVAVIVDSEGEMRHAATDADELAVAFCSPKASTRRDCCAAVADFSWLIR